MHIQEPVLLLLDTLSAYLSISTVLYFVPIKLSFRVVVFILSILINISPVGCVYLPSTILFYGISFMACYLKPDSQTLIIETLYVTCLDLCCFIVVRFDFYSIESKLEFHLCFVFSTCFTQMFWVTSLTQPTQLKTLNKIVFFRLLYHYIHELRLFSEIFNFHFLIVYFTLLNFILPRDCAT